MVKSNDKDIHKIVDFIKLDDIVSQCPNCKVKFSVASNEKREIKYCPYCGFKREVVKMDRKNFYKRLGELIDTPTDRNDILTKRFGAPMKKMTYRDTCIDYVKKTVRCVGYRDYIVSELDKLEKIEQIVEDYDGSAVSMVKQFSEIQEILEQE